MRTKRRTLIMDGMGFKLKRMMVLGLILIGCSKSIPPIKIIETQNKIKVSVLFTVDGCSVYRFEDSGRYRYFTNCHGSTMSTDSEQCGKTRCEVPIEIPGGK